MYHSKGANNKINHLHERSGHIVYKDSYSLYVYLLAKGNLFTIHRSKLQSLATGPSRVKRNFPKTIMCNI